VIGAKPVDPCPVAATNQLGVKRHGPRAQEKGAVARGLSGGRRQLIQDARAGVEAAPTRPGDLARRATQLVDSRHPAALISRSGRGPLQVRGQEGGPLIGAEDCGARRLWESSLGSGWLCLVLADGHPMSSHTGHHDAGCLTVNSAPRITRVTLRAIEVADLVSGKYPTMPT
jgi:hypothetical protein